MTCIIVNRRPYAPRHREVERERRNEVDSRLREFFGRREETPELDRMMMRCLELFPDPPGDNYDNIQHVVCVSDSTKIA
nr:hypothetical protein CFP56_10301 [Quercus suber]